MSANPGAASQPAGPDETIVLRGTFVDNGKVVPMGHGWSWIAAAWSIFARAAGLWIGMTVVLSIIFSVLMLCAIYGVFPFVAMVVLTLLFPIFTAGLMLASRTTDQGGDPQFKQLFAGFRHRLGALLTIGAVYLVANVLITLAVFALLGVDPSAIDVNATPEEMMLAVAKLTIAGLLVVALLLPFVMAIWFAPALVAFHEMGPLQAMKQSFLGCLKNILPFLLYGVIMLVAAALASVPVGLGWLILAPVMAASVYTGYRDIYFSESSG